MKQAIIQRERRNASVLFVLLYNLCPHCVGGSKKTKKKAALWHMIIELRGGAELHQQTPVGQPQKRTGENGALSHWQPRTRESNWTWKPGIQARQQSWKRSPVCGRELHPVGVVDLDERKALN